MDRPGRAAHALLLAGLVGSPAACGGSPTVLGPHDAGNTSTPTATLAPARVTPTATARPQGATRKVAATVRTTDKKSRTGSELDDAQIRDGKTITVRVGDSVWAYGSGERDGSLRGEATGDALVLTESSGEANDGRQWTARRPGTSRITLTTVADGKRIKIGTFTVVVR